MNLQIGDIVEMVTHFSEGSERRIVKIQNVACESIKYVSLKGRRQGLVFTTEMEERKIRKLEPWEILKYGLETGCEI